ncbi:substrate-binding periplasmic protein [Halopseudomonas salegens]|uniref:Amino acid ABC transporter substrate-binding protein, PAAT family n=1 Tax=Halopseudomonas salegens TaxID=1434072 RepID=A0A1H2FBJ4_9GAMM|nr:transporter substrate-binding domain-containing protein [Halopseudomonas salegens]SDU04756.1 amino acid ABC transporter substrate-binding protein, PAAT family [Halopseudomonas salegens]
MPVSLYRLCVQARWWVSRLTAIVCGSLLFVGAAQSAEHCNRLVASGNNQYPPLLWVDPADTHALRGAGAALLSQLLAEHGITLEARNVGPWARAQNDARNGRIDMLLGAFKTDERQTWMDYLHPAYTYVPSVIFVRKGHGFEYNGWDDLRDKRGSTLVNNSFGNAFDVFAREFLDISAFPSVRQSFETLLLNRVDYVIYERYQGMALAEQIGIADQLEILPGSVINEALYFTFSKRSECNTPELRAALEDTLARFNREGVMEQLIAEYGERWSSQFIQQSPADP